ncbi:MAG: dTMP kinase [Burkholderiales bacterium]|nr:dTMP kinase [Anaerolineae bacterium]
MTSAIANSFFLVIEGLDGSGKSEISRALKHTLQQTQGKSVELTFEPHDPSLAGLYIRNVLTKRIPNDKMRTLALAFALNRADHNSRVIEPFLNGGDERIIICDRYYLSSLVYQSDDTLSIQDVMALNEGARQPDLTIFLNASAEVCYERMSRRTDNRELFEEKLTQTREKYFEGIEFLRGRGETVIEVNADGSRESVLNAILDTLRQHGPQWLTTQRPLMDTPEMSFALTDFAPSEEEAEAKVKNVVRILYERVKEKGFDAVESAEQLRELMLQAREAVDTEIDALADEDLVLVFLGLLRRKGYEVLDPLDWTDVRAYALEYEMLLGIKQRGTALLLSRTQNHDAATKKIQFLLDQAPDYADIERLSDFMLVLDTTPLRSIEAYYERDASGAELSPTVRIMQRPDIALLILDDVLSRLTPRYFTRWREIEGVAEMFLQMLQEFQLRAFWHMSQSVNFESIFDEFFENIGKTAE